MDTSNIELSEKGKKYEKEILEVIKKENIFSILDVFAFYGGCSRATFYNQNLDKIDSIKKAIEDNKIKTKQSLKAKWAKSDNPTLQIALFKTICTPEEREQLSQTYQKNDVTVKTEQPLFSPKNGNE